MSDVVYSVELQFLQNGGFHAPAAGMQRLQEKTTSWHKSLFSGASGFASSFGSAIDSIGGAMLSLGTSAATGLTAALTTGLGVGLKMAFDFNEQLETTTISLAAVANANGVVANMEGGMRIAADVVKEMRSDAAKLPGEFKDLENILQSIAGAGAQMGVGLHGMEKIAAQTMTAAAVLKVPQAVAAREMAMLLEGNARHSMPLFTRLNVGMSTKDFNALAPEKRLELIRNSLNKLDPAVEKFTNSWQGIKTTAMDSIRQGVGFVGLPIFNSVKGMLSSMNKMDKTGLRDWGITLGNVINNAFLGGVAAVQHWYPIVMEFAETMYKGFQGVFQRLGPVVGGIFERIESFMKDPQAFNKLEHIVEQLVALRVGAGVAGAGFSGGGSMLSGLATLGGGGAAGAELAATVAGPLAIALAAVGVAAYGAVSAFEDTSSSLHSTVVAQAKELEINMIVMNQSFKGLGETLKPIAEFMGAMLMETLITITSTLAVFADALRLCIDGLERSYHSLTDLFGTTKLNPTDFSVAAPVTQLSHLIEMNAGAEKEKERDRKVPNHTTHINKVEIRVNSNQDPNRIAKRTADILKDIARNPKIASLTGNPDLSK